MRDGVGRSVAGIMTNDAVENNRLFRRLRRKRHNTVSRWWGRKLRLTGVSLLSRQAPRSPCWRKNQWPSHGTNPKSLETTRVSMVFQLSGTKNGREGNRRDRTEKERKKQESCFTRISVYHRRDISHIQRLPTPVHLLSLISKQLHPWNRSWFDSEGSFASPSLSWVDPTAATGSLIPMCRNDRLSEEVHQPER